MVDVMDQRLGPGKEASTSNQNGSASMSMTASASNVLSIDNQTRFSRRARQVPAEPICDRTALRAYLDALLEAAVSDAGLVSLHLDHENHVVSHSWCEGPARIAPLEPRAVVRRVLSVGASAVIVIRVCPEFAADPGPADTAAAALLKSALGRLGIALHDCLLVSPRSGTPQCWTSLI